IYFKKKSKEDLKEIISDYITSLVFLRLESDSLFKKLVKDLTDSSSDPYTVAEKILSKILSFKK
ncbi:MAG: hypothetical protein H8E13_04445, partial [Actinobacteria bacterium]|nr:hypothetical protein [Actinomycetota bacterium]